MAQTFTDRIITTTWGSLSGSQTPTKMVNLLDVYAYNLSLDKQIYQHVFNKVIRPAPINRLFETIMGRGTSSLSNFTVRVNDIPRMQIKVGSSGTPPYVVPTGGGTVVIPLNVAAMQITGNYILPQVGEYIIAPPTGIELEITAVTPTGATPSITVKHVNNTAANLSIAAGQELMFMTGKAIADCDYPRGFTRFSGAPRNFDYAMKPLGDGATWCGKAIEEKPAFFTDLFTMDIDGVPTKVDMLYQADMLEMVNRFEMSMAYRRLFDASFGLFPILKTNGTIIEHTGTTAVTEDDIYFHTKSLDKRGFHCKNWMIPCGVDKFIQYQKLFSSLGNGNGMVITEYEADDSMKTLNLNFRTLKINGYTLNFYKEECFSNGQGLGAAGYNFPMAEVWIPMDDNPFTTKPSGVDWADNGGQNKMIQTVYFKGEATGQVYDMITESVGFLPGSDRNIYNPLELKQSWAIKSEFTQIIHAPECFLIGGLF